MKKEKYLRFDMTSLPYYGFLMQVVLPLLLLLIAATRKKERVRMKLPSF